MNLKGLTNSAVTELLARAMHKIIHSIKKVYEIFSFKALFGRNYVKFNPKEIPTISFGLKYLIFVIIFIYILLFSAPFILHVSIIYTVSNA